MVTVGPGVVSTASPAPAASTAGEVWLSMVLPLNTEPVLLTVAAPVSCWTKTPPPLDDFDELLLNVELVIVRLPPIHCMPPPPELETVALVVWLPVTTTPLRLSESAV